MTTAVIRENSTSIHGSAVSSDLGSSSGSSVHLCVAIQRDQASIDRGQTAGWVISAWTEGGNVPDATVRLVAAPSIVSGRFSFGCGSHDGSGSCDLGEVDATSAQRELQALVVVPVTDTSVTSVRLKVVGSAAHLPTDPQAAMTIAVNAPATGSGGSGTSIPTPSSSPLPVGNLPYLNGSSSTLSPGGNAAGLFPTLNPSQSGSGKPGQGASARTVANATALPLGAPVVGAQLIGLGVLVLAFVLAVTRLSIRRRPVPAAAAATAAGSMAGGTARATGGNKPADGAGQANQPDENRPADTAKPTGSAGRPDADNPSNGDEVEF